jgi:parallel beta-helix repeat protein
MYESVLNGDTLEVKWTITPYNESVYVNKTLTIKHYSYDHPGDFPTVAGFSVNASNVEINGFIVLSGIDLYSSNNRILNNTASVYIWAQSSGNTLRQTIMNDFGIESGTEGYYTYSYYVYHFVQDIDTSNTINGRPIYYLVNQSDRTIPTDAGFAAIVNSRNINATNLSPESSSQGVLVVNSTDVTIANVSLKRHSNGIYVYNSSKITVRDFSCQEPTTYLGTGVFFSYVRDSQLKNVIFDLDTENSQPILLKNSDNNVIRDNIIENSGSNDLGSGIALQDSVGNTITGNSIDGTMWALAIAGSNNSLVFHNNFLRNEQQVFTFFPANVNNSFDNGFEGNYWSDYDFTGQDPDGDGIGNAPYSTDYVTDRYPLMVPWSENRTYERPMEKRPSDSR